MCTENEFDTLAQNWDSSPMRLERASKVADGIRARVPLNRRMRALEYGCGTGLLSFALQAELGRMTLADSSPGMLTVLADKIAARGLPNMEPLQLDLSSDPLPTQRYQLIYTLMTLHHIADTRQILQAFYALLERPGTLCVADLDQEDGSFHDPGFSGHHGFERQALAEKTRQAGFDAVSFETIFHMSRETAGGRREFPIFLMVAEKR